MESPRVHASGHFPSGSAVPGASRRAIPGRQALARGVNSRNSAREIVVRPLHAIGRVVVAGFHGRAEVGATGGVGHGGAQAMGDVPFPGPIGSGFVPRWRGWIRQAGSLFPADCKLVMTTSRRWRAFGGRDVAGDLDAAFA